MWALDWQVSSRMSAPTERAAAVIAATGETAPVTFETCVKATRRVFGVMTERVSKSMRPSGVRSSQDSSAPVRSHSCCQGTMFAWCSARVHTMRSPGPTRRAADSEPPIPCDACPMDRATRLMASVAFFVHTISVGDTPTNEARVPLALSKASVASSPSRCVPRWTAPLERR